ncbi:MAG: polysaccharide biosynthesis/export family protein, partial [Candidatus Korobacteraceae bacterium]
NLRFFSSRRLLPQPGPFLASVAVATLNCIALLAFSFGISAALLAQNRPAAATLSQSPIAAPRQTPISSPQEQRSSGQASDAATALLLGAGDLLDVRVFDTPELSGKFRVDNLGQITLPVGGTIKVLGLTAEQVQVSIEDRLRQQDILHHPHVEVFVLEYATQGVTVMGEVKLPGVYPLLGKHTVLDFISLAGGVTSSASKTVILTHEHASGQVVTFDLSSSVQTEQQDFEVEPGDRIVVTRAGVVYVIGDVGRPGGYLIENKDTVTVLQALALAQGLNKTAKLDARLIRNSPSGRIESDLPLKKILANQATDPGLQDGDILFVPVSGTKEWADKGVTSILQMAVGVVIYGRL